MIERRQGNDRRKANTLGLLDGWAGIGVFARLLLVVAIITATCWLVLQCIGIVNRITQLLP